MKNLLPARAMFTVCIFLASGLLRAETPSLGSLQGCWWDESGRTMLEIGDRGVGALLECGTQASKSGQWAVSTEGRLSFVPQGAEAVDWAATLEAGQLLLTAADGSKTTWRREARSDRESRLGEAFWVMIEISKKLETDELELDVLETARNRAQELSNLTTVLAHSLAGDDETRQENLIIRFLEKKAPEADLIVARQSIRESACRRHLSYISAALALHETKHKKYPEKLDAIEIDDATTLKAVLKCPASGTADAYVYVSPASGPSTIEDAILIFERDAHPSGMRWVVTLYGDVLKVTEAEFLTALIEGARSVRPQFEVKSAKVVNAQGEKGILVEGTVAGLRTGVRAGKQRLQGTLKLVFFDDDMNRSQSAPLKVIGSPADGALRFSIRVGIGSATTEGHLSVLLTCRDEMRGDSVSQTVVIKEEDKGR